MIPERITHKVLKTPNCWIWQGGIDNWGYGYAVINKKTEKVHRIYYREYKGEIPENLIVRHTCDIPFCVNPAHLVTGTDKSNAEDRDARGRGNYSTRGKNGRTKLTNEQVEEIKTRTKEKAKDLAQEYNVSVSLIRKLWGKWTQESGKIRWAKYKKPNVYRKKDMKKERERKEKFEKLRKNYM